MPFLLLLAWQLLASGGAIDERLFSSPAHTAHALWMLTTNGTLASNVLVSLRRSAIGLLLGVSTAVALATVSGLWRLGEELVDSTIQMVRTVPVFALTSVFVVWFGLGELSKELLIAMACFFPVYLNVHGGIRNVDRRLVEMAVAMGKGRRQIIRHVVLPGAMPQTLVGLRYSLSISVLALVVAETLNTTSGLGYLMANAQQYLDTDVIFACVVVYCLMGITADLVVRVLEWRTLAWRTGVGNR
ncbi:ABC-type nitrate/sulfonate/bicarbonate transport system, permease component [Frankia torreyi]|uniref:ABC-type nitrate/sulfonate/bicarbonate transport system, permease component n=1 Tax=Frankia torreyi TaxID=1856 RepID=A0A0D8B8C4_9ACTN|nr:ABC-type nitrate/sulfonate/bicarbonate transport system, permease component [Frankia torreyi]